MANAITAAKYLKKAYPNVKKIVLVHPDDGVVPVVFPIMKGLMEANGLTVLGEMVRYPNEMQDFSPIASKINSYKDADAAVQLNGIG